MWPHAGIFRWLSGERVFFLNDGLIFPQAAWFDNQSIGKTKWEMQHRCQSHKPCIQMWPGKLLEWNHARRENISQRLSHSHYIRTKSNGSGLNGSFVVGSSAVPWKRAEDDIQKSGLQIIVFCVLVMFIGVGKHHNLFLYQKKCVYIPLLSLNSSAWNIQCISEQFLWCCCNMLSTDSVFPLGLLSVETSTLLLPTLISTLVIAEYVIFVAGNWQQHLFFLF